MLIWQLALREKGVCVDVYTGLRAWLVIVIAKKFKNIGTIAYVS